MIEGVIAFLLAAIAGLMYRLWHDNKWFDKELNDLLQSDIEDKLKKVREGNHEDIKNDTLDDLVNKSNELRRRRRGPEEGGGGSV